jgi:hypothetical protein
MIQSIVTLIISCVLIISVSLLIRFILVSFSKGTLTVSGFFATLLFTLLVIMGAYLFSYTTFNLIAHRQKSVEKSWFDLLSKGILLEGKVTSMKAVRWGERKLEYEFYDPEGKRRRGHYYLTKTSARIKDKVTVWYVHNKLHTLL